MEFVNLDSSRVSEENNSDSPVLGNHSESPYLGDISNPVLEEDNSDSPVLGNQSESPFLGNISESPFLDINNEFSLLGNSPRKGKRFRAPSPVEAIGIFSQVGNIVSMDFPELVDSKLVYSILDEDEVDFTDYDVPFKDNDSL